MEKASDLKKQKGIKIQFVNIISIFFTAFIFIITLYISNEVRTEYKAIDIIFEKVKICEQNSALIKEKLTFLSEQARAFVVTQKDKYSAAFLNEIFNGRSMIKAINTIENECSPSEVMMRRLKNAVIDQTKILAEKEMYSMRLAYKAKNDLDIPKTFQEIQIKAEDKMLSNEELLTKALNKLFEDSYIIQRQRIFDNCTLAIEAVEQQIRNEFSNKTSDLGKSLTKLRISYFLLMVVNFSFFVLFVILVIRPLRIIGERINKDEKLDYKGAAELKKIAYRYNEIYSIKAKREKSLLKKAEYDQLTGILNRRAFDQICTTSAQKKMPIALLLIDLDNFKSINDSYGHSGGDTALKVLAKALKEAFRANDYIARIGGDEFAAILPEFLYNEAEIIKQKIASVNKKLENNAEGIKKLSVSVGVAFSETGFSEKLFNNADAALYAVKENGKCGCKIYEEIEN